MNISSELRKAIETQLVAGKAVSCKGRLATPFLFAVLCMSQAGFAFAQVRTETPPLCGDSDSVAGPSDGGSVPAAPAATVREATLRRLPRNILQDQKDLWLFPVKLAQGHHWLPAALIAGGTAGLIGSDPKTMPHFRQTSS